ncbi:MAG TPA: heme biosynthesis HemY N-terminal domain-containing protein [Gammaproteobacteria bacterium]|nr:heme biosynthesis HemY N-terminal domain-containing protein [Gammaproteobacteria bacterium]
MRAALLILVVLAASVVLSLVLHHDNGYVLLSYGQWSLETSLVVFVAGMLLLYSGWHIAWRVLAGTAALPGQLGAWRETRRQRRARRALNRGLIKMNEGHWRDAEKTLTQGAEHAETPLLNYLAAARAAQLQRADDRRDQYLRKAYECTTEGRTAVLITQAELQIDHQQYEQALATLTNLRERAASHTQILMLLMRCYVALRDWNQLRQLLPRLRQHRLLSEQRLDELAAEAYGELLDSAVRRRDAAGLRSLWKELPRELQRRPELVRAYARALHALDQDAEAAAFIEQRLKRDLDDELARLYGELHTDDDSRRLAQAEGWIRRYGDQPALLLAAARLCMRGEIWGKARQYLEGSIHNGPVVEAYQELGRLLRRLGENDASHEAFEAGLGLAVAEKKEP